MSIDYVVHPLRKIRMVMLGIMALVKRALLGVSRPAVHIRGIIRLRVVAVTIKVVVPVGTVPQPVTLIITCGLRAVVDLVIRIVIQFMPPIPPQGFGVPTLVTVFFVRTASTPVPRRLVVR